MQKRQRAMQSGLESSPKHSIWGAGNLPWVSWTQAGTCKALLVHDVGVIKQEWSMWEFAQEHTCIIALSPEESKPILLKIINIELIWSTNK